MGDTSESQKTSGTELFYVTIAYDYGSIERNELMRSIWSVTPWMVEFFTDGVQSDRWREIRDWCFENFGPEASPIHGRPGNWQTGNATIHGWTWMGFSSKEMLDRFMIVRWVHAEEKRGE